MSFCKATVDEFLEKKIDDYTWVKDLTRKELASEIKRVCGFAPAYKIRPWKHQLASIYIGITRKRFLFFLDMGCGKTFVALSVASIRKQRKQFKKSILVLVPNTVNILGWCEEIQNFTDFTACPMLGSTKQRWEMIKEQADVFVLNYAGIVHMLKDTRIVRGKKQSYINLDKVAELSKYIDFMIMDESQNAKTHDSLTTRACVHIADRCKFVYGMTGTPFSKPEDLWSQFFIVDGGDTLGKWLGLYRSAYYSETQNYWGGYEYTLRVGSKEKIRDRIKNKSIRYDVTECNDLPEKTTVYVPIPFSTKQGEAYKKLMSGIVEHAGNRAEIENTYMRLRQLSSGFLDMKIDGKKVSLVYPDNKKIEWLVDKLQGLEPERKVVVFHTFIKSGVLIAAALKKSKISFVHMRGTDAIDAYKKFKADKKTQVLVVNAESGGTGLNLQVASVSVFFEPVSSIITKQQAEKRTHRAGQKTACFQYELVTKGSIEDKIITATNEGKNLLDSIMEGEDTFG